MIQFNLILTGIILEQIILGTIKPEGWGKLSPPLVILGELDGQLPSMWMVPHRFQSS